MIAVLVPCWNKIRYTGSMVDSVLRNSAGHDVRFIFVDNGSHDGTFEFLSGVPNSKIIRNSENVGVNRAWNQLNAAVLEMDPQPEVVVLANNDILAGPGWLDRPLEELRKGEKFYYLPNGILHNESTFDQDVLASRNDWRGKTGPGRAGWCIFYTPREIRLFHPIPEALRLWFGDDWIHYKLERAGYQCRTLGDSFCLHYISKTISDYPGMTTVIENDKAVWRELMRQEEMKDPTWDELKRISSTLGQIPDTRSEMLRAMTKEAPTTEDYNRFLFEVTKLLRPAKILELGTDRGRSAGHFAEGHPEAEVTTIDIDPACSDHARALHYRNLKAVTGDSLEVAVGWWGDLDFLFIDSLHTYDQVSREFERYSFLVKSGGLIFMDDIHLDGGVERFWNSINWPKIDLTPLHFSGFGVVKKP